jgi:hypothetical protein
VQNFFTRVLRCETGVCAEETSVLRGERRAHAEQTRLLPEETSLLRAETSLLRGETRVFPAKTCLSSSETRELNRLGVHSGTMLTTTKKVLFDAAMAAARAVILWGWVVGSEWRVLGAEWWAIGCVSSDRNFSYFWLRGKKLLSKQHAVAATPWRNVSLGTAEGFTSRQFYGQEFHSQSGSESG